MTMPDEIWISDIEGSHCRCWNGPTYGGFKGEGHLSTPYIRRSVSKEEAGEALKWLDGVIDRDFVQWALAHESLIRKLLEAHK